ncbi:MAG: tRNA pseudouridine(13) synthase TruD [Chloroflexi bacterium]|nr:tRNA pseudouridine(13) synthase TruD [Chloroflexota bacterium]MDA1269961.1 tRNA pseudouridine(13) synthase TruD [Chloroflexota bacterium]
MAAQEDLRFNWSHLPPVASHLASTGGEIRSRLEDFVVTEIPKYLPNGQGLHAYAFIEKRGLTTHDVISHLRSQGVAMKDVGVAGRKDKYAVTRQWISVPAESENALASLDGLDGVTVLETSRHRNKLGVGHLAANRFEITVRGPVDDWQTRAQAILGHLERQGLPNYFGPQRFGRFNSNVIDAMRLLKGADVPGGRRLQMFFLSSLQSHLFNWNLKRRMESGFYQQVLEGDRAQKHDTGGVFVVEDAARESERAARLEISASLPLHGHKVRYSAGHAGRLEQEILDHFGFSRGDLRFLGLGSWRISRVRVDEISLKTVDGGYTVGFTLPSGAYATCLLRELVGPEAR